MTESALAAVGHRLRGADLALVAGALPAAIALITRICPQARSEMVAATIEEAFARGSAGNPPDGEAGRRKEPGAANV